MDKKKAYEIVLDDLTNLKLFNGYYDAKHGKKDYMYGINTVMECIAYKINDEVGDNFSEKFIKNMILSEERTGIKHE